MKILLYKWNSLFNDVEEELKKRGHEVISNTKYPMDEGMIEKYKWADVVILWNQNEAGGWQEYIEKIKKARKKTILYQHGRRGSSRMYPPFNEKLLCDKVLVWGEADKKRHLECGTPEDKVIITGTAIFNDLKRIPHKGKNILFVPEHWGYEVEENIMVANRLKELTGVNVRTKILKGEHSEKFYPNPISSGRNDKNHLETTKRVLGESDLLVSISESTLELMAEILDIPVVIADIWIPKDCAGDERYLTYKREYSDGCFREKDIFNLGKTIKWFLKHPKHLREERKQASIDDGGINIPNPLERIIKAIEQ